MGQLADYSKNVYDEMATINRIIGVIQMTSRDLSFGGRMVLTSLLVEEVNRLRDAAAKEFINRSEQCTKA